MHTPLHIVLIEPDEARAQLWIAMLTALGAVVTHATNIGRGSLLLSQLLPDLLLVGVYPTSIHSLRTWLSTFLASASLPTLLYAEHHTLLDWISATLPSVVATKLWPCSQSDVRLLLTSLLHSA